MLRDSTIHPGPPVSSDFGSGRDWVQLTTTKGQVAAHLLSGRLEQDGIESTLDSSNPNPGAWLMPFGDPAAIVRILVRRSQLEWAQLVLRDIEGFAPERSAPSLPRGRSVGALLLIAVLLASLAMVELADSPACVLGLFCP